MMSTSCKNVTVSRSVFSLHRKLVVVLLVGLTFFGSGIGIANIQADEGGAPLRKNLQKNGPSPYNIFPDNGIVPVQLHRVKRDNEVTENANDPDVVNENELEDNEEGQEECVRLPPSKPSKSSPETPPVNLLNLLDNGSHSMSEGQAEETAKAILILGNTGAGKTTLTQILAGDLRRLHAVETQSESLVIIDDDNRIGGPTTMSKTLVPELVFKDEGGGTRTAFYDCPGFDDTRGPEKDIAANFFMNQVVRMVAQIKMLFLVNYSSIKMGNDRLDFDLLVSHATKFMKDIERYSNSIGLVVTKVNSFNSRGRYLGDKAVMKAIVGFLQTYNATLHYHLGKDTPPVPRPVLERKIKFVEIILQPNSDGEYSRISFSRSPQNCGPLSGSPTVLKTREQITKLYTEGLEYSPVNWRDFGYTLKDSTKLALRGLHTIALNQAMKNGISAWIEDFRKWHDKTYLTGTNMTLITAQLDRSMAVIGGLLRGLRQLGNRSQPELIVLAEIQAVLETLGYSTSLKVRNYLRQQQRYFEFFDEANTASVTRSVRDWLNPVETFEGMLEDYQEWYQFCEDLQAKVGTYDWQLNKPSMPGAGNLNWLGFVEREGGHQVRSNIKALGNKLGRDHTDVVGKIMKFALKPVEAKCGDGKVTVTGNFVRLTEFLSSGGHFIACDSSEEAKNIEVYAAHTLFIDEDIDGEGKELNLVMIAPNWVVVGGNKLFNLNGATGPDHSPDKADTGGQAREGYGLNGSDGLAGKPGGPGGSFFGLALHAKDINKLEISSIGGRGGKGQRGGRGGQGNKAEDATFYNSKFVDSSDKFWYQLYWFGHHGFLGFAGGNGGDGGAPGVGGQHGKLEFLIGSGYAASAITGPSLIMKRGSEGEPGAGGEGGNGGESGRGVACEKQTNFYGVFGSKRTCDPKRVEEPYGPNGDSGWEGSSQAGLVDAKGPAYSIFEWKSLLEFKYSLEVEAIEQSKAFVDFLETDPAVLNYFGLQAWTEELERIFSLKNPAKFLPEYVSRVEKYAKNGFDGMSSEEKKVVAYLLASAYSKLVLSEQDKGMGMVVDLRQYLNIVHRQMERLKQSSAVEVIQEAKERLDVDLQGKIIGARRFVDEVVTPSVHEAELQLHAQLDTLGRRFEDLILKSEVGLNISQIRLAKAVEAKGEQGLVFRQILKVIGTILRFTDLVSGMFAVVENGMSLVATVGENAVGVVDDFKSFVEVASEVGGEGGLLPAINSGEKLFRSAGRFLRALNAGEGGNRDEDDDEEDYADMMESTGGDNEINEQQTGRGTGSTSVSARDLTKAIAVLGEEVATKLYFKFGKDEEKIATLNGLVSQSESNLKDALTRKLSIEQTFIPVVQHVLISFQRLAQGLQSKLDFSLPELAIGKWQISSVLRQVKNQLDMLGKGVDTREFVNAVDRVQQSLTMVVDLFEEVVRYEDTRRVAEYMAVISSAPMERIHVKDKQLSSSLARMEKGAESDLFSLEYVRSVHAFKQWVFPFARFHLTPDLEWKGEDEKTGGGAEAAMKQIDRLQLQLESYKASTLNPQDTHIIHTNFSSDHKSSRPFFIWKNDEYSQEIADLLSGKPVHLKADVSLSVKGRDAVKFKLIELTLRIPEGVQTQRENQQRLDSELEHFGVVMTHSGVSHYRFQDEFYVMMGVNQTLRYNFERGSSGNRLGKNRVYEKFKSGDYLLSPYTLWTVQLVKAMPGGGDNRFFRRLQRFAPYVQLELVGTGIYVEGERVISEDLRVGEYYVKDESVRGDVELKY